MDVKQPTNKIASTAIATCLAVLPPPLLLPPPSPFSIFSLVPLVAFTIKRQENFIQAAFGQGRPCRESHSCWWPLITLQFNQSSLCLPLAVWLSVCLSVCCSVCCWPLITLQFNQSSLCLPLSVCLSVCRPVCLSIGLPLCLLLAIIHLTV